MRLTFDKEQCAARLRAHRERWGLTQAHVAAELVRLSIEAGDVAAAADDRLVRAWENAEQRPGPRYQDLLCRLYGATPEELCFRRRLPSERTSAVSASSPAEPWALAQALESSIASATLRALEATVASQARAYPRTPPEMLRGPVLHHLDGVIRHLQRPQPIDHRRRLTALAGLLAGLAGSLAFDTNDHAYAAGYFDTGTVAATEADDHDLYGWLLASWSLMPTFAGQPERALRLLQAAANAARKSSASRRAWIAALEARAHAGVQDARACIDALGVAERTLDEADDAERRNGTDFFDAPRLVGLKGTCHLLLRRTRVARAHLEETLARREPGDVKGRALVRLDLAATYVLDHEIDEACRLFHEAITIPAGSLVAPIAHRARAVRAELEPWRTNPIIGDLDERLAELPG